MASTDHLFTELAREHLHFETLEHRKSGEDFREVASWGVKAALQAAYDAGRAVALPNRVTNVPAGREWVMAFPETRAEGGIETITYFPAEVEEVVVQRSPAPDARFLSTLDIKRLVLGIGLRADELHFGKQA